MPRFRQTSRGTKILPIFHFACCPTTCRSYRDHRLCEVTIPYVCFHSALILATTSWLLGPQNIIISRHDGCYVVRLARDFPNDIALLDFANASENITELISAEQDECYALTDQRRTLKKHSVG